jgi:hypothetical protein
MTAPKPTEPIIRQPAPSERADPERLGLSATQLVASGLAAMSATVAASYFGVAGTVIGAALGSVVTVVGNAVYGHWLGRTRSRVRRTLAVATGHRFALDPARPPRSGRVGRRLRPKWMALAAAGLFVTVLAVITGFEFASGQPLSATVAGKHGAGVSIGGGSSKKAGQPSRSHQPAGPSSSSAGSVSPTVTVTVTPSESATPTESSAPASSPAPSAPGSPTGSPAARG